VSRKSKHLTRRISDLVEASERLRQLLRRYEKANLDLVKLVDSGQPAIDALGKVKTPVRRREVTETFEEFEAARHQVRLALLALCLDEGTTRSEVGRVLGISRQLASRLSIEVEENS
jgi:hypothetical protein